MRSIWWTLLLLLLMTACGTEPLPLDESKLDTITRGRLEEVYSHDKVWVDVCLDSQDMETINAIQSRYPSTIVKANTTRIGRGWPCYSVQTYIAPKELNNLSQFDVRRIVVRYHIGDEPAFGIDKLKGRLLGTVWFWPDEEKVSVSVKVTQYLTSEEIEKQRELGLDIDPQTWQPEGQQSRAGYYRADLRVGATLEVAAQDLIITLERQ